jgi:hypothetical protein
MTGQRAQRNFSARLATSPLHNLDIELYYYTVTNNTITNSQSEQFLIAGGDLVELTLVGY